ncbi:MAG TPA: four helix bundle protein [Chthoniobacterales bacterium]|nr:four helix bundle protein [Chthoniobacterales bacterium]
MTKSERTREDSFWLDGDTSRVGEEPDAVPHYDLKERTARYGEAIIDFAKRIPRGPLTDRIIDQLVGAGTIVGANYIEADDSVSKKEFLKCIGTCKKEARETNISYAWSPAQFLSCRLTHESSGWKRGHYI